MKKILCCLMMFILAISVNAQSRDDIKNGAILHCWCWSFKTVESNLDDIAAAGYTALQVSPINECLEGEKGGLDLMSRNTGKWYYHYQPTDWKIGNYQLGTRDEFISMCKKAKSLGIGVIVDVLPNHTTPRKKSVSQDLIDAVGGMENLYHAGESHKMTNFSDRLQCTSYDMGGLPDVNTENPDFQAYFMRYINDCIDCGASGFRYDTAKHIALPDDPLDPKSPENDFWPIFTGRKAIRGENVKNAENLFIYGEVLQGGKSREADYSEYFPTVASIYGTLVRGGLKSRKLYADLTDWKHKGGKDKIVTWVESHDTYANAGESAKLTNFELRAGWAFICARDGGTPLFFNRPKGAEATQFPGVSKIGDAGNDEYKSPEVREVNLFRRAMIGEPETLENGEDASLTIIKRGGKGAVIINLNKKKAQTVNTQIDLPDGKYTDRANKIKFTVKNGIMTGRMPKEKIAVVY
ncbi:MAG: alpha-amylase [Spirochaetales bacterium]|nr:alpha-amylase [Spirochaetales bacterium]